MRPFRFLHIADVHLDTSFSSREAWLRNKLRESVRIAFRRAVDLCIEKRVDALLIAGDLFDNARLSFETERFILGEMGRLDKCGIKTLYSTGNHDPGHGNYRAAHLAWPSNVHIFSGNTPLTVTIPDMYGIPAGKVTSCGHRTDREPDNLAAAFEAADGNIPHVAMLHTMVSGAASGDMHERYAPSRIEDMIAGKYSYWALGHIHLGQRLGDTDIYYPGNIQGRNPKETGAKGGLLVELRPGSAAAVRFVPFSPVEWKYLKCGGLGNVRSFEELKSVIKQQYGLMQEFQSSRDAGNGNLPQLAISCLHQSAAGSESCLQQSIAGSESGLYQSDYILRVELTGDCPLSAGLKDEYNLRTLEEDLCSELDALWVEVIADNIVVYVDLEIYRQGLDILSLTIDILDKAKTDNTILNGLLPDKLAVNVPEGQKLQYLKRLLENLDREAAFRFIRDDTGPAGNVPGNGKDFSKRAAGHGRDAIEPAGDGK